jgi:type 1 glutamine amidotransferase
MKKVFQFFLLCFTVLMISDAEASSAKPKKILVFTKTGTTPSGGRAYRHNSAINSGTKAIQQLGLENNFIVDTTENSTKFNSENLKQYRAIVFLCPTGNVLNEQEQRAFQQYIQAGGGFVGIHAAADAEYEWPWYGELVGAYFGDHPQIQEAVFNVVDASNIATKHLPQVWKRKDELYNFKWLYSGINVLITIDENSYKGGKNGEYHPMSWYHEYDGGRSFYTEMGHDNTSYADPVYMQHILGGIKYAMGAKPQDALSVVLK